MERGCDLGNSYVPESKFKISNIPNNYISGIIYKKSQYLAKWELRYMVIGPGGLLSFKDENSKESFRIAKDTVNEMWTRFEVKDKMLVLKVLHAGRKTEFGIPITDYTV